MPFATRLRSARFFCVFAIMAFLICWDMYLVLFGTRSGVFFVMAAGRLWMGANYSYGVWESFACQADPILRSFCWATQFERWEQFLKVVGFGIHKLGNQGP
jgi:hypothetical protein